MRRMFAQLKQLKAQFERGQRPVAKGLFNWWAYVPPIWLACGRSGVAFVVLTLCPCGVLA